VGEVDVVKIFNFCVHGIADMGDVGVVDENVVWRSTLSGKELTKGKRLGILAQNFIT